MKISKKVALVVVAACALTLGSAQVGTARADAPVKVSVAGHVVSAGHFEQVRRPNRCVKAGTGNRASRSPRIAVGVEAAGDASDSDCEVPQSAVANL
ncbi:hypothetical protein LRL17_18170 [Rhodococcus qingshengii]|uniref:hypothetical protein n=1 Tax=Rhodococcus qingshengii TaxID=334542 RepID=UPI001E5A4612|nr:hypothetical protein [Rhodococcus qingshengii]UGQ49960.1 hypothetical protein LRL17_18170 [Rhodococcus qingshengii]